MRSKATHIAHVKNGRLVLDEPTDLPEGSAVELYDDPYVHRDGMDDDLDDSERARLQAAVARGVAQMRIGRSQPMAGFLTSLRRRE